MKQLIKAALVVMLAVLPVHTEPQLSRTISLTTGTAVRIVANRTMANSLFIQVQPGSSNPVYVLYADRATACSSSTTSQIVAVLGPGTSDQPGSSFTYPSNNTAT